MSEGNTYTGCGELQPVREEFVDNQHAMKQLQYALEYLNHHGEGGEIEKAAKEVEKYTEGV